jgi:hypothetical protein
MIEVRIGVDSQQQVNNLTAYCNSYVAAVAAQGVILSLTIIAAFNAWCITNSSILSAIVQHLPMFGATAAAHGVDAANPLAAIKTFLGGWIHTANGGAVPNGTNAYLKMGVIPSTGLSQYSVSLGYVGGSNSAKGGQYLISADKPSAPNNQMSIFINGTTLQIKSCMYDGNTGNDYATGTASSTVGTFIATRSSNNYNEITQDGTVLGTNTNISIISPPALELYLCASNENNSPVSFSDIACRGYLIFNRALTSTERNTLSSSLNTLQAATR